MNTSRWPHAFFAAAALYGMVGLCWGLTMAITENHATYSAHAHLNLLGWITMALMGAFYALLGQGVANWVKLTNFVLSNIGVVCMISGLYLYLGQAGPKSVYAPLLAVGGLAVVGGFLVFGVTVIAGAFRKPIPA
jgi:peptidoglycan/LPS O-acetylase OafA/YrhL